MSLRLLISSTAKAMASSFCRDVSPFAPLPQKFFENLCNCSTKPTLRSPSWLKLTVGKPGMGRSIPPRDTAMRCSRKQRSHIGLELDRSVIPDAGCNAVTGRCKRRANAQTTRNYSMGLHLNLYGTESVAYGLHLSKRSDVEACMSAISSITFVCKEMLYLTGLILDDSLIFLYSTKFYARRGERQYVYREWMGVGVGG